MESVFSSLNREQRILQQHNCKPKRRNEVEKKHRILKPNLQHIHILLQLPKKEKLKLPGPEVIGLYLLIIAVCNCIHKFML